MCFISLLHGLAQSIRLHGHPMTGGVVGDIIGPEKDRFLGDSDMAGSHFSLFLFRLFREEHCLDVGENTALGNGHP